MVNNAVDEFSPWYWGLPDLFRGVSVEAKEQFMSSSKRVELPRGRHLFRAQDAGSHAFFLQSGMIKVYHLAKSGAVTVFWYCLPNDILGQGGVLGTHDQAVNAQAISNSVLYAIRRSDLEDVIMAYPQIAINTMRLVGIRLRLVSELVIDAQCLRAEARLSRLLLRLARNWGNPTLEGVELRLRVSHQELANMIGACRQTVNGILRAFVRDGTIAVHQRNIQLRKIQQLRVLADFDE